MKIISFNVNGIRSACSKGLVDWIKVEEPDIICFQEIKANIENIPKELVDLEGYYSYWYPAVKKGYSGVGIMSKYKCQNITYGIDNEFYDFEGRCIRIDYEKFSVLCTYFPSGTTGDVRQDFKESFLDYFTKYILNLESLNKRLIIAGDVNICHKPIDIHNPVSNKNSSGFLPQEREWMTDFISLGYVDALRQVSQEPHQYTWWTFRAGARERNLGWRIDYHLVGEELTALIKNYKIHNHIFMSDHCPIELEIDL